MSYPLSQTGSITLPSGSYTMRFTRTSPRIQHAMFDVSGDGSARPEYVHGHPVEEYVGTGVIKRSGASTFGLAQSSTMTMPSDMDIKAQTWRVRRRWRLFDVTGTGDASKEYTYSIPYTSLSIGGVAKTGYVADHANDSLSITTVMSQFGTLAGTLKLANKSDFVQHSSGGVTQVQLAGAFSGATTFTPLTAPGTNDDFEWLMGDSVDAPVEGTFTLDLGDTTDLTPNVVIHDVMVELVPRDGGSMRITALMRKTL